MEPPRRDREPALLCIDCIPGQSDFEAASPAMQSFGRALAQASRHEVPVLLLGERGTGKTTFARALHAMSPRSARPFVRIVCPAVSRDLAIYARAVRGGTLFLDEVAELSPALQGSALRLVQDSRPVHLHVVSSTRHDLEAAAAGGSFRKDLYYRLNILELRIPPLRERIEDVLPIARAFLAALAHRAGRERPELSPALERALLRYSWPGNVQELLGILERGVIMSPGASLDTDSLPERIST